MPALSVVDFFRDGGIMLAAAISFFIVTAIVPFCLFVVTSFGSFMGRNPDFYRFFLGKVVSFFPSVTADITQEFMKLVMFKKIGAYSIVLYGVLSFPLFASVENALNAVFKVRKKRHFILSVLLSLTVATMIFAILIASFFTASAMPLLNKIRPFFPEFRISHATGFIIRFMLPFFIVFSVVAAVYKLLPKAKVGIVHACAGALLTAFLLEVAKHVFTWYVLTIAHFGKIYGSLATIVMFLLYVYYSSCIFLIGAEVVHNLGITGKHRPR